MKAVLFLSVTISFFCITAQSQTLNKKTIKGSWININVIDYYESAKTNPCDVKYFGNERFVPLYLSFKNKNQVKITYRIEQKIFTYNVKYSKSNSIVISNMENTFKIYVIKDVLKLEYNHNLITFKKVSDYYSTDVFSEFIKNIIFKKHNKYLIASFTESNNYNNKIFTINNFQEGMKEIFKCDKVNITQLGSFKYGKTCLPEIAIYYNEESKWPNPRRLGIIAGKDEVKFIDDSGVIILILKPF